MNNFTDIIIQLLETTIRTENITLAVRSMFRVRQVGMNDLFNVAPPAMVASIRNTTYTSGADLGNCGWVEFV